MPDCQYCNADLPDAETETERMDILQQHIWGEHQQMYDELITGQISSETYAKIEAGFLTNLIERDTREVEHGA